MIHYPKVLLLLMLSLAACNKTNEAVSVQASNKKEALKLIKNKNID